MHARLRNMIRLHPKDHLRTARLLPAAAKHGIHSADVTASMNVLHATTWHLHGGTGWQRMPDAHLSLLSALGVQMLQRLNGTDGFNIQRYVDDWQELIRDSEFQLCPRGKGPTSYRMYESLQAETIPIYIWWNVRCLNPDPKCKRLYPRTLVLNQHDSVECLVI